MILSKKILYWSLAIVWISVIIKCNQKSLKFLDEEPEAENIGDRFRFRKKFREIKATPGIDQKDNAKNLENEEPEENNADRFRFRKKIKESLGKATEKLTKNENENEHDDESNLLDEATEPSQTRMRDKIQDKFRKVKEKIPSSRKTIPNKFEPQYNFGKEKTDPHIPIVDEYEREDFILPYKPGDSSHSVMINLAKNIIRTGNYMRNGKNNHMYQLGLYNYYNYRPDEYAEVNVTSICTNYLEYGGVVFGKYICPVEGYSLSSNQCCGPNNEQYCCEPVVENEYSKMHDVKPNILYFYLLIIVPSVLSIVIGLVLLIYFRKRIYLWYEKVRGDEENEEELEEKNAKVAE